MGYSRPKPINQVNNTDSLSLGYDIDFRLSSPYCSVSKDRSHHLSSVLYVKLYNRQNHDIEK